MFLLKKTPGLVQREPSDAHHSNLDCNKAQSDFNVKCKPGEAKPHPEYEILRNLRKKSKRSESVAPAKISCMANKITGWGQGKKIKGLIGTASNTGLMDITSQFRNSFSETRMGKCALILWKLLELWNSKIPFSESL